MEKSGRGIGGLCSEGPAGQIVQHTGPLPCKGGAGPHRVEHHTGLGRFQVSGWRG